MYKVWLVFTGPLDYEKGGKRDDCRGVFTTLEKARSCASTFIDVAGESFTLVRPDAWRSKAGYVMVKEYFLDGVQ